MVTRVLLLLLIAFSSYSQGIVRRMQHVVRVDNDATGAEITPAQLSSIQTAIPDNTTIYFEAGETYEAGDIDLTSDVSVLPYRAGTDPRFRGSREISSLTWTAEGGGVYSTPMVSEPNWIWIDGECAKMAETARIPILSRGSNTTITVTHALVSGYTNIVGSKLLAKETPFKVSRICTVTAYNGAGVITVNQDIPQGSAGAPNVDLVLLNDTEYFSGDNEWVWRSGTLYVKAASSPSTMDIRASENVFAIKSTGNLTVRDIEFQEYYTAGVWSTGVMDIENCYFHDIRDVGVFQQVGVTGTNISNNVFDRIENNGIFTRPCTNSTFNGNALTTIGMGANYGWQTWTSENLTNSLSQNNGTGIVYVVDAADLTISGSGNVYNGNSIENYAYNGIHNGTGTTPTVTNNRLVNGLNRFIDGGAIYFFHFRGTNLPTEFAEVSGNYIDNQKFTAQTVGIYADNRTRAANIHHNTIENCYWGILCNYDTEGHTVDSNNIYNCLRGAAFLQYNLAGFLYTENINNTFTNNVIATTTSGDYGLLLQLNHTDAIWNPFSGTGSADNNTYIKNSAPDANDVFVRVDNFGSTAYTLAEFQSAWSEETSSTKLVENPVLFKNLTNAISNEDAEGEYEDFSATPVTTYTIPAYYSRILNEIAYSNTFASASSQYFNAGTTADIQFTHTDAFTIALRFKVAANPGSNQVILDNRTGTNRGYAINMMTTGAVQIQLVNTTSTNRYQALGSIDFADNAWHQLVFVWTGSAGKTYVDGILRTMTELNNLTATIASTEELNIGRSKSFGQYFDGLLKDVFIWTGDKSGKIVQIYNGGRSIDYRLNMPNDLPIHGWRMGQTGGLIDGYEDIGTSATSLDLTAVNGPTASTDAP